MYRMICINLSRVDAPYLIVKVNFTVDSHPLKSVTETFSTANQQREGVSQRK